MKPPLYLPMIFIYNILFPFVFIFFVPSIISKLIKRGGTKKTFLERFSIYGTEKKQKLLDSRGAVWIHSVSVGETQIALSFIGKWLSKSPGMKFVLSTTTTTAQALAEKSLPKNTVLIFCPIDFIFYVKKTFDLIRPSALVIFETELWPNMICQARKRNIPAALVNGRISDKSYSGYRRFSIFFSKIVRMLSLISVQTELDKQRFSEICPGTIPVTTGNMKFDQPIPEPSALVGLSEYFGEGPICVLMGASTHPGEEKLIASVYKEIKVKHPELRLLLVPRHTERKAEIESQLNELGIEFRTRTGKYPAGNRYECLLVDTTGEMLQFMVSADIVVMGKSFAGHNEGHNLVEPALLAKPIIAGAVLKNFKFILKTLMDDDALIAVGEDSGLRSQIEKLVEDPGLRLELGRRAKYAVSKHRGATEKTITLIEELLKR